MIYWTFHAENWGSSNYPPNLVWDLSQTKYPKEAKDIWQSLYTLEICNAEGTVLQEIAKKLHQKFVQTHCSPHLSSTSRSTCCKRILRRWSWICSCRLCSSRTSSRASKRSLCCLRNDASSGSSLLTSLCGFWFWACRLWMFPISFWRALHSEHKKISESFQKELTITIQRPCVFEP